MISKDKVYNYTIIITIIGFILLVSGIVTWLSAVAKSNGGCDFIKKTSVIQGAINAEAVELKYQACLSEARTTKKWASVITIIGLIIFVVCGMIILGMDKYNLVK
jgi:hypothetical protein